MSTAKNRQKEAYVENNHIKKTLSRIIGNFLTFVHNIDKIDRLIPISIRVKQIFNDKAFIAGIGVYKNRFFSGQCMNDIVNKKGFYKKIDQEVLDHIKDATNKYNEYAKEHKLMRQDILNVILADPSLKDYMSIGDNRFAVLQLIEYIFEKLAASAAPKDKSHAVKALGEIEVIDALLAREDGARFHSHPVARKTMLALMETLSPSVSFATPEDEQRMRDFVAYSVQNNLHMIELRTHFDHMDASKQLLILSALQKQGIYPSDYVENLVCGYYMYFNPQVRSYNPAFETTAVIGQNDIKQLALSHRGNLAKIKQIQANTKTSLRSDEKTINKLFIYGGRGKYGGKKDKIEPGMEAMINNPNSAQITLTQKTSSKMRKTASVGNVLKNIHYYKNAKIEIAVGDWRVGAKPLDEINNSMTALRDRIYPEYIGAEQLDEMKGEIANIYKDFQAAKNTGELSKDKESEYKKTFIAAVREYILSIKQ